MRTIDQMIAQEVLLNVSTLVYDLTVSNHTRSAPEEGTDDSFYLWAPVVGEDAWEECARDDGWEGPYDDGFGCTFFTHPEEKQWATGSWEELCGDFGLDPSSYVGEVFEHYAVTDWFADQLEAAGERVVRDWHGLDIWARTTGQGIVMDGVIQKIYEENHQ